jgi:Ca-activated chloride channel homolog
VDRLADVFLWLRDAFTGWRNVRLGDLQFPHQSTARLTLILLIGLSLTLIVVRLALGGQPGRSRIALPRILPWIRRSPVAFVRHAPLVPFLFGLAFFAVALADPVTTLHREEVSYPGRRIGLLLDASSSMMAPFSTKHLGPSAAGVAFSTNVAAADYFLRLRMHGKYRDLIALIEFGNEAYVVTPFTSDYDNVLLSISLIGDLNEWGQFPDQGTIIAQAIEQSVDLFKAFGFLHAAGNVMVIFSDGQDTQVKVHGRTVSEILEGAVETKIPVYFIRTVAGAEAGGIIPDDIWKPAVERTGGKFYAAANEDVILSAIRDIDRLSAGRIEVKRYTVQEPRFSAFAMAAVGFWTLALLLQLTTPYFRRFP